MTRLIWRLALRRELRLLLLRSRRGFCSCVMLENLPIGILILLIHQSRKVSRMGDAGGDVKVEDIFVGINIATRNGGDCVSFSWLFHSQLHIISLRIVARLLTSNSDVPQKIN